MIILRQSTARTILVGPILDASGVAKTDDVVGSIKITKNGTVGAANGSATLTHDHAGKYLLALTASDTDTLGIMQVSLNSGTNDMPMKDCMVLTATAYDTLVTNGTLASTTSGRTIAVDASGNLVLQDGSLTAAKIASDAITASKIATDAVAEIQSGLASQTSVDTLASYVDTEVAAIKAKTDNLPTDPADASNIAASFASIASSITTLTTYVDTEVAAIKAKTDNLPVDPADQSAVEAAITAAASLLATAAELAKVPKQGEIRRYTQIAANAGSKTADVSIGAPL